MIELATITGHLDALLQIQSIPDYPGALNGVQLANRGAISRIAASVDISKRVIDDTISAQANLLLVHHGMFWGGPQRITGVAYERLRLLFAHNVAVYSAHLPLDAHPTLGNNALLARTLMLEPSGGFARYQSVDVGVRGECDVDTLELFHRADAFARLHGGAARTTPVRAGHRTRRWAICTGAGASSDTLLEARSLDLDTLIVGEGPHHTAVMANDIGLVVIYAGHYATETLGVRAVAEHLTTTFDIPSTFIAAPTGL
jgi:dinuclear metal center YbgI/SA1388 family protein